MNPRSFLALVVAVGASTALLGSTSTQAQVSPTTTLAAPTTVGTNTTVVAQGTTPGGVAEPAAGGLPTYATCEEAISQVGGEVRACSEDLLNAFDTWGGKLGLLYSDDLSFGVWTPFSDHRPALNESALYACMMIQAGDTEIDWLEDQLRFFEDYSAVANEKLFDIVMTHVCPDLGYTRQAEWDWHVPADVLAAGGGPTSTAAAPVGSTSTTATPASTTATAPTSTAGTTLVPATATTLAPPQTVNAIITTSDGPGEFSCTEILYVNQPEAFCDTATEQLFAQIVTTNAQAFEDYVYSDQVNLGIFEGAEFSVNETAFPGLLACSLGASGQGYAAYETALRGQFTMASTADATLAWQAAFQTLCPFVTPPA